MKAEQVERCKEFGREQFLWLSRHGTRSERDAARRFAARMDVLADEVERDLERERDEPVRMAAESHGTYGKKEHAA